MSETGYVESCIDFAKYHNYADWRDAITEIAQLRAELAQLKAENVQLKTYLKVTCHVKHLDKVGFDFEILGKINDLQEQLDEARKVIEKAIEFRKSFPHDPWCNEANCLTMGEFADSVDAWAKAHPTKKGGDRE